MPSHKQRVQAMFRREALDRFPMWYGADPETTTNIARYLGIEDNEEAVLQALDVDFRTVRPTYIGPEMKVYPDGSRDTIWGVKRGGTYYGQPLNHPLANAETIQEIDDYPWPRLEDWDIESVRKQAEELGRDYAIIGGAWSPFFHEVAELIGMETMFIQMAERPDLVDAVVKHCLDFYLELSIKMFDEMADCLDVFFFGNDFGGQTGLLCSPAMWRRFFGPGIKAMVDLGHKYGLKTGLHSCGSINEILPDLLEMGLDIINPLQTTAKGMNPVVMREEFGDQIIFFGGIDVQHLLNNGSVEEIQQEVKRMVNLFQGSRGYILAPAHDYLLPEIPSENIVAMYQAGRESR